MTTGLTLLDTQGADGTAWFAKMARKTNAELQNEVIYLQRELDKMKSQLELSLRTVLGVLDNANDSVARHLRTLQMEDSEQRVTDV